MKIHFVNVAPVDFRLGDRYAFKYIFRQFFCSFGYFAMLYYMYNIREIAVFVTVIVMMSGVVVMFFVRQYDFYIIRVYAVFIAAFSVDTPAMYMQSF